MGYYSINNKIYNEDCIKGMKRIKSDSIDIIIADPPYNIGKTFENDKFNKIEDYINWSNDWINESIRILKPTGTLYIYGFSEILAYIRVKIGNKLNVRWLIWHYTNRTLPTLNYWQRSHESILACCKDKRNVIFNRDLVREPYTEKYKKTDGKIRKATKCRYTNNDTNVTNVTKYSVHKLGCLPRDVIKVPALAGGRGNELVSIVIDKSYKVHAYDPNKKLSKTDRLVSHPTVKPLNLTKKLLNASKHTDTTNVCIPFSGSGTEALACKILGLNFIGFELNKDYVLLANHRLRSVKS